MSPCALIAATRELEVVDEVIAVSLKSFCKHGGGVLPYPGSDVPALGMWYASNRIAGTQGIGTLSPSALVARFTSPHQTLWKGKYSKQVPVPVRNNSPIVRACDVPK
jgi:hypothetical protein